MGEVKRYYLRTGIMVPDSEDRYGPVYVKARDHDAEIKRLRNALESVSADLDSIDRVCDLAGVHRFDQLRAFIDAELSDHPAQTCVWKKVFKDEDAEVKFFSNKHTKMAILMGTFCYDCGYPVEIKEAPDA